MAIIRQLNKKTGVTYVYESYSYRDKDTKQPRAKRKLIGRIDEETGEVIPTRGHTKIITTDNGPVGSTQSEPASSEGSSFDIIREKDAVIVEQRKEIARLHREMEALSAELEKIASRLKQP